MRYKPNKDFSLFKAYADDGDKRREVALIEIDLLDARVKSFAKGRFKCTQCNVSPTAEATDSDLKTILEDLPKLKRKRLDFALASMDRYLLEAMMGVTGRTSNDNYHCEHVDLDDVDFEDRRRFGSTVKRRAAILGNYMTKRRYTKEHARKNLRNCHSYLKDGYPPDSDDSLAYL